MTTQPFTRVANTPHAGQARACSPAVARYTRRVPSSSSSTRTTARPSRSSSNVVSLSKPVVLMIVLRREQK
ncbi:hypothetical protein K1Y78_37235 [Streptomyces sp. tea 10]|nr:hypothetical protein [Streptomyces sp. tea 10]